VGKDLPVLAEKRIKGKRRTPADFLGKSSRIFAGAGEPWKCRSRRHRKKQAGREVSETGGEGKNGNWLFLEKDS